MFLPEAFVELFSADLLPMLIFEFESCFATPFVEN